MSNASAAAPEGPTTPLSADGRLDSWKEIAAYLKRDIRTVQRWEKLEGLPVRRHQHQKRGSAFAYRDELDTWWQSRGHEVDATPSIDVGKVVPIDDPPRSRPGRWRIHVILPWVVAGGDLAVAAVSSKRALCRQERARPSSVIAALPPAEHSLTPAGALRDLARRKTTGLCQLRPGRDSKFVDSRNRSTDARRLAGTEGSRLAVLGC